MAKRNKTQARNLRTERKASAGYKSNEHKRPFQYSTEYYKWRAGQITSAEYNTARDRQSGQVG